MEWTEFSKKYYGEQREIRRSALIKLNAENGKVNSRAQYQVSNRNKGPKIKQWQSIQHAAVDLTKINLADEKYALKSIRRKKVIWQQFAFWFGTVHRSD